jgi:RNA polymerase sigma-70 factor (ECF subfamily)
VGHDEAADLVQDVFARVAGSHQRHRLINPGGFLRRIAQNLLIDRSRKKVRDNIILLPLVEASDAPLAAAQENELHAQDLRAIYQEALRVMPEKTRRVFLMHRVDECSYREIHEQLGISIATVEYHMMRALTHIAEAVDSAR